MKYTTKVKQAQKIATIRIEPKGGDLSEDQFKKIISDPYGKELIRKGMLSIEGFKVEMLSPDKKK